MSAILPTGLGNAILVAFLLAQAADGVFTYVGLATVGNWIEGNPLIAVLVGTLGRGAAVACSKLFAATLGIVLHLADVHHAVAVLTILYVVVALIPWTAVLFL